MSRTLMAVFSNPTSADKDEEFNTWYNTVHLKDLMAVPGVVGATRYRVQGTGLDHGYLALYEVEGDPADVSAAIRSAASQMEISPALDQADTRVVFLVPVEGGSVNGSPSR